MTTMDKMSVAMKLIEVKRHTEEQMLRCRSLLKKLKTIQLEELEEYGEQQLESVISTIADAKRIQLAEATVPDFFARQKAIVKDEFYDEEDDLPAPKPKDSLPSPPFHSKLGHEEVHDVAQMMQNSMKETLFSTMVLGKDANDTDSSSEYEDDAELRARFKVKKDHDFTGYLPVEYNPATKWARQRHEIITRYCWLTDALRHINIRLNEQDELLRQITSTKPKFQFDELIDLKSAVIVSGPAPDLKSRINVYRDEDGENIKSMSVKCALELATSPMSSTETSPNGTTTLKKGAVGGGLEHLRLKFGNPNEEIVPTARRCMPLISFRQRKMYQLGGIHNVIGKPLRKPSALCSCYGRTELCAVCSGRSDKVKPVRNGAMTKNEICALLDHTYHKIASTSEEKPLRLLTESSLKTEEWSKPQYKKENYESCDDTEETESDVNSDFLQDGEWECSPSPKNPFVMLPVSTLRPKESFNPASPIKKVCRRLFSERKSSSKESLNRRIRKRRRLSDDEENYDDEEDGDSRWTPQKVGSIGQEFKKRRMDEKYDIDHIVIPYSIAAATRVEKIEYKEIMIPSWRSNPIEPMKRVRERASRHRVKPVEDVEDVSIEEIIARHHRSEIDEKKRFLAAMHKMSNRRARRSESNQDGSELSRPSSPTSETSEDVKLEDLPPTIAPGTPNQISAAEASLAVTALKISAPTPTGMGTRRRTISSSESKEEVDSDDDCGYVPFEPREFPLSEAEYDELVQEMEAAYAESERAEYEHSRRNLDSDLSVTIKQEVLDEDLMGSEEDDPDWKELEEMEGRELRNSHDNVHDHGAK